MLQFVVPTRVKTLNLLLSMNQRHNAWHPRPIGWGEGRGEGRLSYRGLWLVSRFAWNRWLSMNLGALASWREANSPAKSQSRKEDSDSCSQPKPCLD